MIVVNSKASHSTSEQSRFGICADGANTTLRE